MGRHVHNLLVGGIHDLVRQSLVGAFLDGQCFRLSTGVASGDPMGCASQVHFHTDQTEASLVHPETGTGCPDGSGVGGFHSTGFGHSAEYGRHHCHG